MSQQRPKALDRRPARRRVCLLLEPRRLRGSGRRHRVAPVPVPCQLLVLEQQRLPHLAQVPLHVVRSSRREEWEYLEWRTTYDDSRFPFLATSRSPAGLPPATHRPPSPERTSYGWGHRPPRTCSGNASLDEPAPSESSGPATRPASRVSSS